VVGVLALKWGAKLKGLPLLLPKLKVLSKSASMLVSVAAYALIWGWRFALGFVALLFIHELGHYIQLRREGIRPTFMVFVPFLGAAVGLALAPVVARSPRLVSGWPGRSSARSPVPRCCRLRAPRTTPSGVRWCSPVSS
jgi:hypothetical protein